MPRFVLSPLLCTLAIVVGGVAHAASEPIAPNEQFLREFDAATSKEIKRNKQVVRDFYAAVADPAQSDLTKFFTSSYQIEDVGVFRDRSQSRYAETNPDINERIALLRKALPGFTIEIVNLIGEDERVFADVVLEGKQKGVFMGIAPTGKTIRMHSFVVFTLSHGKIEKALELVDEFGLMKQLGYVLLGD